MRLAGPLHGDDRHVIGQAFLVARMRQRIQRRVTLEARRRAHLLLATRHSGHICRQPGERRAVLLETIRESLSRKRLTVVVHAMRSNAAMLRYLRGDRLTEPELAAPEALLLIPANAVWQSRTPDLAAALEFVDELQSLGNRLDHRHVQLISDANHLFSRAKDEEQLFALEEWWNRAKLRDVSLACLYRSDDLRGVNVNEILKLHKAPRH